MAKATYRLQWNYNVLMNNNVISICMFITGQGLPIHHLTPSSQHLSEVSGIPMPISQEKAQALRRLVSLLVTN